MAGRKSPEEKLVDAALRLAAERAWDEISLMDIVQTARLSLGDLPFSLRSRTGVLLSLSQRMDGDMLSAIDPAELEGETLRDRLFDIMMTRFDILEPHKMAIRSVVRSLVRDPAGMVPLMRAMLRSVTWMAEAAGVTTSGLRGRMRVRGLALVWGAAFRVWLREDDLNKVMAELDQRLLQGDRMLGWISGVFHPGRISDR